MRVGFRIGRGRRDQHAGALARFDLMGGGNRSSVDALGSAVQMGGSTR